MIKFRIMSVKSRSCDCVQKMCGYSRNESLQTGFFTSYLKPVTEWLKEQSPLTEDELQKLCIGMDDFKVLNNLLSNKSNYSLIFDSFLLMICWRTDADDLIRICFCFFII